ncbi:DUF4402 domain-containing protein [Sneathiella marina]|uniref:DUF4402 domain-containing protein n=1 Tax=Sneathiella marina TaxID=2950108 RepID=A0ABY4VY62_9PROT|nr:DUF4402 domain-containing protein [Sneathiella marina]USG59763.1 DUF4402 domain-containing protein [Sneathiella marina]
MKRFFRACGLAAIGLGMVTFARAGEATDNPVAIELLEPLTLEEITPLNFGTMFLDTSIERFVAVTDTGDFAVLPPGPYALYGTPPHTGVIKITGRPNAEISISLDFGPAIDITNTDGDSLTFETVRHFKSPPHLLDGEGEFMFITGGVLRTSVGQAPGTYTGTYLITANYT